MAAFQDLVNKYKKRRHDTVVDSVTTALSMADSVSVDMGLLEDTGVMADVLNTVSGLLPFAVIAVTEQCSVLLGKKTGRAGAGDAAFRMLKTGAAMGVGAAVAATGAGALAALPLAVGTRVLMDRYRGHALTGQRVTLRTKRLHALSDARIKRLRYADNAPALTAPEEQ